MGIQPPPGIIDEDISAFWKFLQGLRVKLNGIDQQMLEFSRQIDAQELYTSTAPLVEIGPRPPHDGNFHIRLIVKSPDVRRTRREHSKMWNLVEAAVLQLEPQLERISLPAECQPLTPEEKARKTEREEKRREEERALNELVAQTLGGDKQAYQRLYEQVRLMVQKILIRRIIENRETIEGEILSYLFKNIHLFRPERVSFKTWVNRVTLNLVVRNG
ncbi:TPA: hypothetical protein EYP66_02205 [Candidatus Poribacteria bacterium]|nr:hypothetical protein [Candidatus Poribacteria bacterium]